MTPWVDLHNKSFIKKVDDTHTLRVRHVPLSIRQSGWEWEWHILIVGKDGYSIEEIMPVNGVAGTCAYAKVRAENAWATINNR